MAAKRNNDGVRARDTISLSYLIRWSGAARRRSARAVGAVEGGTVRRGSEGSTSTAACVAICLACRSLGWPDKSRSHVGNHIYIRHTKSQYIYSDRAAIKHARCTRGHAATDSPGLSSNAAHEIVRAAHAAAPSMAPEEPCGLPPTLSGAGPLTSGLATWRVSPVHRRGDRRAVDERRGGRAP